MIDEKNIFAGFSIKKEIIFRKSLYSSHQKQNL